MNLISNRQLSGVYGTVRPDQEFECPDDIAIHLLRSGYARKSGPPLVLYETRPRQQDEAATGEQGAEVTCLCVTRNRRDWLPKAIRSYQAQTVSAKELLIVADGDDVRDLISDDKSIRLIHIEEGHTIGEKRNFGVQQSTGSIVAHFDDDDWSAPERLADQIQRLEESGKAVTGYRAMYFASDTTWWMFHGGSLWALGTSLCYRKEWALAHPFQPEQVGEDGKFVQAAREHKQIVSVEAGEMMIASVHDKNTSPRHLWEDAYQLITEIPQQLLGKVWP